METKNNSNIKNNNSNVSNIKENLHFSKFTHYSFDNRNDGFAIVVDFKILLPKLENVNVDYNKLMFKTINLEHNCIVIDIKPIELKESNKVGFFVIMAIVNHRSMIHHTKVAALLEKFKTSTKALELKIVKYIPPSNIQDKIIIAWEKKTKREKKEDKINIIDKKKLEEFKVMFVSKKADFIKEESKNQMNIIGKFLYENLQVTEDKAKIVGMFIDCSNHIDAEGNYDANEYYNFIVEYLLNEEELKKLLDEAKKLLAESN
jgi:hypothetical protein